MTPRSSGPQRLAIVESHVMGRLPVIVTATVLAASAVGQFADRLGSKVLGEWGGESFNVAWSLCAILAAVLIWVARCWPTPQNAAVFEIGGIVLMSVVITIYVLAVHDRRGLEGNLIPLGLCVAVVVNSLGRAVLLWRRRTWVRKVARG